MNFINPSKRFVHAQLPNWLMRIPQDRLSHGAKIAYARLAQFTFGKKFCYPSTYALAKELGVSPDSAGRYIKELIAKGFLFEQETKVERYDRQFTIQAYWFVKVPEMLIDDDDDIEIDATEDEYKRLRSASKGGIKRGSITNHPPASEVDDQYPPTGGTRRESAASENDNEMPQLCPTKAATLPDESRNFAGSKRNIEEQRKDRFIPPTPSASEPEKTGEPFKPHDAALVVELAKTGLVSPETTLEYLEESRPTPDYDLQLDEDAVTFVQNAYRQSRGAEKPKLKGRMAEQTCERIRELDRQDPATFRHSLWKYLDNPAEHLRMKKWPLGLFLSKFHDWYEQSPGNSQARRAEPEAGRHSISRQPVTPPGLPPLQRASELPPGINDQWNQVVTSGARAQGVVRSHFNRCMQDSTFRENLPLILEKCQRIIAGKPDYADWLTLPWLLKSDDNWQKVLSGTYDYAEKARQGERRSSKPDVWSDALEAIRAEFRKNSEAKGE